VVFYPDGIGPSFDTGCVAGSGADVIELGGGAYLLTNVIDDDDNATGPTATPQITSPIIIEGRGAIIVRSTTQPMRAFSVSAGGSLDLREVHVKGFAVRGGNGARGGGGGMGAGGAIFVHGGSLLVQWSTFEGNTATGGNGSTGSQFDGAGGGGGGLGRQWRARRRGGRRGWRVARQRRGLRLRPRCGWRRHDQHQHVRGRWVPVRRRRWRRQFAHSVHW